MDIPLQKLPSGQKPSWDLLDGGQWDYPTPVLANLPRSDFLKRDSEPPILTIEAAYSKHRRTDVIPLRRDFAERIRAWIASKGCSRNGRPLFDVAEKRTAEMIKKDLERVGVPYVNERGHYADFHALRKTFITNLSRAGVPPKTTQML